MKRGAVVLAAALVASCSHPSAPPSAAPMPVLFSLKVDVRDPRSLAVEGRITHAGTAVLELASETMPGLVRFEVKAGGAWRALDTQKRLEARECIDDCTVRYVIDLDKVERSHEGVIAIGQSTYVAPPAFWLVQTSTQARGTYELTIDGAESPSFATGLRRHDATHFYIPTGDLTEGSFTAFGHLRRRLLEASGASIELVITGDEKPRMTDDELAQWVKDDAACVARLYQHFPVPRATIFIVPVDGFDEVGFGKVLSLGGASIIVFMGTGFTAKATHDDWVLVHEMVHLGFPTMYNVRWLTEGLATYYEPILRERAGWQTREWLWNDFSKAMKRGIPGPGEPLALDKREGIDAAYWGGALFLLMADIAIRQATSSRKSLDDVMHAVLTKGGDATVVWSMPELIATAKRETGTDVFGDMVERYAIKGERIDFPKLLRDLGVLSGDKVSFDEAAAFAVFRRGIEK